MKAGGLLLVLGLSLHAAAWAQAQKPYDPPRTAEGHPDFQGVWANRWSTNMERPADVTNLVVSQEEASRLHDETRKQQLLPSNLDFDTANSDARSLSIVAGEYRSSLIVDPPDGKLPYSVSAQSFMPGLRQLTGTRPPDNPEERSTMERCLGGIGWAPMLIRTQNMLRQIVQTPAHLVILTEAYGDVRIIGIGGTHDPAAVSSPIGDSIAWWDGDTLVVETAHFSPHRKTFGIPLFLRGADAQVTERFRLIGPDELLYRFTVIDPSNYSRPWTGEYALTRTSEKVYEFACHEGNYGLANMLSGGREQERRAAAKAQGKGKP